MAMYSGSSKVTIYTFVVLTAVFGGLIAAAGFGSGSGTVTVSAASSIGMPTIGSFTDGSGPVTPGGYVSLYARNVAESGSGAIAGVRFYRESNGTGGLQPGSDAYVALGVLGDNGWTAKAPTTGLAGSQTYYAVAYDTAGASSSVASVGASLSGSGFSNWTTLQPFLAKLPLSVGPIASASVVNFGTTVYTGPLDTTITLDRIREDNGPNRSGDGATFTNNGNPPLPTNRGNFFEFTINPQTGSSPNFTTAQVAFPGPLRFMIDTSGDVYFTGDHYATDRNLYISGTPSVGSVAVTPATATAGAAVVLTATSVSETISPAPNLNASTGGNVLATVTNVQFFLDSNGTSGLQTDTDRLLGSGAPSGTTWTLSDVSTAGLNSGVYTVYAVGVDPAGNAATQTSTFTLAAATRRTAFDFDGDGKTDIGILRPSGANGSEWWWLRSSNGGNAAVQFGASTDTITPVDFTGDGKTDVAFWRPSTGFWYVLRSEDFSFYSFPFGATGDVPVPGDYDGDGKADAAVFRESSLTWYISRSSGGTDIVGFGIAGDKPVNADYDGDGKADIAIFRPNGASGAEWWVRRSSNASVFALQFGSSTDKAVPGDFTGDGKADVAFWRPSTGAWNVLRSEDFSYYAFPFGANGDVPSPGDYDGDGKIDAAVFRPSSSTWYANKSGGGTLIQQFGIAGDIPLPSAFVR